MSRYCRTEGHSVNAAMPPRSDSRSFLGLPPLPWEEAYDAFPSSEHNTSSVETSAISRRLSSLLSASSYPMAPPRLSRSRGPGSGHSFQSEGLPLQDSQNYDSTIYPDFNLIAAHHTSTGSKSSQSVAQDSRLHQKHVRTRPDPSGSQHGNSDDLRERRRKQIRLAQRAYRSRQNDRLMSAERRIKELEAAVQNISDTVITLSDKLLQSELLSRESDCISQLHDAIQTCLSLVQNVPAQKEDERLALSGPQNTTDTAVAGWFECKTTVPLSEAEMVALPERDKSPNPSSELRSTIPRSLGQPEIYTQIPSVPVSMFIEQLQVTCIYQGYLSLSNPSYSLDDLQRPFCLLLDIMDRERIAAFFEASLHARVSKTCLKGWEDVPFFSLGGAGTYHAKQSATPQSRPVYRCRYHQPCDMIEDPLSNVSSHLRNELEGQWFDMQDLEAFLRYQQLHLIACPTQPGKKNTGIKSVNVAQLIKYLICKAVCLGRSPGFRRRDVEAALLANGLG
ncbi:hypothetical protein BDV26DRAFT_139537 [Aspergillus bertholletiae]|uniref:BZIP domain-containing protein n=1 Tax=Aspergillus bertholletiae TaxID=1226010 RepID=A0A5N7BNP1_9EURO|nr:hypothetical protein BDV26DRAFT_139537 [Aspergillus bertholletiae]